MARKKRPTKLRPKSPARIRKRRRARKDRVRGHHYPELVGLGLGALGVFVGLVLYAGWDGGYVGRWFADALIALFGDVAYAAPVALVAVGALMVARSALLDVQPFRAGLALVFLGAMLVAGGGHIGDAIDWLFGLLLGQTGQTILGGFMLAAGILLLSGASLGALLRGTGHAVHRVGT